MPEIGYRTALCDKCANATWSTDGCNFEPSEPWYQCPCGGIFCNSCGDDLLCDKFVITNPDDCYDDDQWSGPIELNVCPLCDPDYKQAAHDKKVDEAICLLEQEIKDDKASEKGLWNVKLAVDCRRRKRKADKAKDKRKEAVAKKKQKTEQEEKEKEEEEQSK
jgi:hypothetical protein